MKDSIYLKKLAEEIHSATVATVGADGHPQTRVIDISDPSHVARERIVIGEKKAKRVGYVVGQGCIGCRLCYSVCPQKCIDISQKPVVIVQNHCLHCGRCAEICPKQAICRLS